jgi:release factor glutamine methyltransferase
LKPRIHNQETVETLLAWGREQLERGSESPRLDAEILLGHALGLNRAAIYTDPGKPVTEPCSGNFMALIAARSSGQPVAQLTGRREFWSLSLKVSGDVLVPRPETELLVERTLAHLPESKPGCVLDLGTGSGAIAIAIATERGDCTITATDISRAALAIATENGNMLVPGRIDFVHSDWFDALIDMQFDLIVSNPPYVATGDDTDRATDFEPAEALFSGADGLNDLRRIIAASPAHLVPGGYLLLEHGLGQAESVCSLMKDAGFDAIRSHKDLAGIERVTEGRLG